MSATIQLTPKEITEDDLEKIFEMFCTAFDVLHFPHDNEFWRTRGLQELRVYNRAGCTLQGGSIFKAEYRGDEQTIFDGCSWIEDHLYDNKMKKFKEALKDYEKSTFSSRNKTSSEYQHQLM